MADRANVVGELAGVLHHLVEHDEVPDLDSLVERFAPRPTSMPDVQVLLPATAVYDALLEVA